jgi:AcrR family transcriptional regulator
MEPTQTQRSGRGRARSAENDAQIVAAIIRRTNELGYARLSLSAVASSAGVSHRTVLQRHANRSTLGAAAWNDRVGAALSDAVEAVIAAGDAARFGSGDALVAALQALTNPEPERGELLRCAAELLIAAIFDPLLRLSVVERLSAIARRSDDAAQGFLLTAALGLIVTADGEGGEDMDRERDGLRDLAAALSHPSSARSDAQAPPSPLPPSDLGTGDPRHDALLRATLDEIARCGYHDATVAAISRRIGLTQGFLFGRYGTKSDLLQDAFVRHSERDDRVRCMELRSLRQRYGSGVAFALALRERRRESEAQRRRWDLAWLHFARSEALARGPHAARRSTWCGGGGSDRGADAARGVARLTWAIDHGAALLGELLPSALALPFEVVTIPWLEGGLEERPSGLEE